MSGPAFYNLATLASIYSVFSLVLVVSLASAVSLWSFRWYWWFRPGGLTTSFTGLFPEENGEGPSHFLREKALGTRLAGLSGWLRFVVFGMPKHVTWWYGSRPQCLRCFLRVSSGERCARVTKIWLCVVLSQDTYWRHCVTGPELPFFRKRKGVLKIDQSVKLPWDRLSMGVTSSCSSAPGRPYWTEL